MPNVPAGALEAGNTAPRKRCIIPLAGTIPSAVDPHDALPDAWTWRVPAMTTEDREGRRKPHGCRDYDYAVTVRCDSRRRHCSICPQGARGTVAAAGRTGRCARTQGRCFELSRVYPGFQPSSPPRVRVRNRGIPTPSALGARGRPPCGASPPAVRAARSQPGDCRLALLPAPLALRRAGAAVDAIIVLFLTRSGLPRYAATRVPAQHPPGTRLQP
ncbi:hypothetical protein BU26DRAFT_571595 [Trematosphaeria pertusa]|uniref:Uncharacterized protein n=1 Tax=Trematosphaeria pertusa TaxID=390896 RepID=A0A6A6HUK2_9PLEO|nr:uncharacterized protein BU26DRAFT_571595 [Trematosphaeria pertusa]KAF2241854.1 hypothetical protein BU26DRAFT_571595 [Trematosphaeria pertusa]